MPYILTCNNFAFMHLSCHGGDAYESASDCCDDEGDIGVMTSSMTSQRMIYDITGITQS